MVHPIIIRMYPGLQNHLGWIEQMSQEYGIFRQMRGLILTGWQWFDHFAVICETLPVGLPSVAVNLLAIAKGKYDWEVTKEVSRLLQCSKDFGDIESIDVGTVCKFPGAQVYQQVAQLQQTLANIKQNLYDDYQVAGWLSPFSVQHNYSSAWYLDQIADKLEVYTSELQAVGHSLREEMLKIFHEDAVDEFQFEYVEPELDRLRGMSEAAKRIGEKRTFPQRAFPIGGFK